MTLRVLLTVVVVLAWSAPANAQKKGSAGDRFAKGKRVHKRGKIGKMRAHRVTIAGRKTMTVGEISDAVFADHRAHASEIRKARKGLRADPVETDEVIETDDAVVITTSTSFTVVDPDEVRRRSPRFKRMRKRMKARGSWSVSKLDAKQRAEFAAWRDEVKAYPAGHPLREALDKGDDALIDAVLAGKGDFEVTETLIIPKVDIRRDAAGRVLAPTVDEDGAMNFSRTTPVATRFSAAKAGTDGREDEAEPPKTRSKGAIKHTSQFLAGFTEEDAFEWHKHIGFPSGHLDVTFNAWYAFGLRIPIEVSGRIEPGTISTVGANDVAAPFEVVLSAKTLNADASYYREVGLDPGELHDGKEFVLAAGFDVVIDVKAGWVIKGRWRIPKGGVNIDWGQHFKPPHGDCGSKCGPEFWIPAEITGTSIGLLGIVKGSARAGFRFSGNGVIDLDYEALYGKDTISSWSPGRKQQGKKRQNVSFGKSAASVTLKSELDPLARSGAAKRYGYRLSDPRYTWKVEAIPGVRADIDVNAWPIITDTFPIGPKWFDSLAIPLGTLKLTHHKGTRKADRVKQGEKSFSKKN